MSEQQRVYLWLSIMFFAIYGQSENPWLLVTNFILAVIFGIIFIVWATPHNSQSSRPGPRVGGE